MESLCERHSGCPRSFSPVLSLLQAAARQETTPDRISFVDTVRWLLEAKVGEQLPDLVINPSRPDRHEPRVIKDLQDTYRKMTKSRNYLREHPNSGYAKR